MRRKLLKYLNGYRIPTILTPLTIIIEVILEISIPFIMAEIIDVGIPDQDINFIFKRGLLMIVMALLALFFGGFSAYLSSTAGAGFAQNLRQGIYYKIQDFSFSNIDKFSTPSLVTRLTTDVTNTQMAFIMSIRMMVRAPFMLIFAFIASYRIDSELSLIFLFAIPFIGISLAIIASQAFPRFKEMLEKYDTLNAIVQENLTAIRVVKAFVRGDYEEEKFDDVAASLRNSQEKAEKIIVWNMPIMQFVIYGCIIAVAWSGGQKIVFGDMQTGQLVSFISYVTQILVSLMMLSMAFMFMIISRASVNRVTEVLSEEPEIQNPTSTDLPEVQDGSIIFDNVSFSYADKDGSMVLEDINLSIKSGETIGIIGGTGSSKTSLVQLIARLYDVTEGELIVGGHNVKEYNMEALRDSVAMVLQNNLLFSGTIKDNLKWGNQNASDEEIIEACKISQAHDFIMSFSQGYETDLGQGGVNVSGGQKQRISIARSLLQNPKIIILDDSTSAVDTKTENSIRHALQTKLKETTTLIISQRVSSIQDADRILVLDDGKINGIGSHEELLENNDIYMEIYESQQKGVGLDG